MVACVGRQSMRTALSGRHELHPAPVRAPEQRGTVLPVLPLVSLVASSYGSRSNPMKGNAQVPQLAQTRRFAHLHMTQRAIDKRSPLQVDESWRMRVSGVLSS